MPVPLRTMCGRSAAWRWAAVAALAVSLAGSVPMGGVAASADVPPASSSSTPLSDGEHGGAGLDRIAFTRFSDDPSQPHLWTGNIDGTDLQPVGEQVGWFPDWSPDRMTLVFDFTDDNGDEQIATIRPDGTGFVQLTDQPGYSEAADTRRTARPSSSTGRQCTRTKPGSAPRCG